MSNTPTITTQFQKGKSGNPLGRPKGSKNKSTILREAMLAKTDRMLSKEVPKVLMVVLEAAKNGDMSAAKMILDRAVPVKKAGADDDALPQGGIHISISNLTAPDFDTRPGALIEGESSHVDD